MLKIFGTGNLVDNAEVKTINKEDKSFDIVSFTLASNNNDEVEYIDCSLTRSNGKKTADSLIKGTKISFVGNFFTEKWTTKDGNKASKPTVRIDEFEFVSKKKD